MSVSWDTDTETTETETAAVTDARGRTVSPRVAAQRRLGRAEKDLKRAQAFWNNDKKRKTIVPPTVEEAEAEYAAAVEELKSVL